MQRLVTFLLVFVITSIVPGKILAAPVPEVKLLGFLGADAYFSARYLLSDLETTSPSSSPSVVRQSTWEEELNISAGAYIYHPGFLTINLGGGPLLIQRNASDEAASAEKDETLFNVLLGLDFLQLKSYPFSTYYRRSHPSMSSSLSTRFVTEKNEYGLEGRMAPASRVQVSYGLSHFDNQGSGFGSVIDEIVDLGEIRLKATYRDNDRLEIYADRSTRDTASGSTSLPIRRSVVERSNMRLFSRNTFGANNPFFLNQTAQRLVHQTGEDEEAKVETRSYTASGRVKLTEGIHSAMSLIASDTLRTGADAKVRTAQASVNHELSERASYGVMARGEAIRQASFERNAAAIDGHFSYSQPTAFGSVTFGTSLGKERLDQTSGADTVLVFDESATLIGTSAVDLRNEFVVPSSVVVTNDAGTQVFVEGIDYRVVVIGSITSIQRLVDGSIFDGQTVFIDYEYQTSGTAEYDRTVAGVNASASIFQHLVARARYDSYRLKVISGELTTPKNDRDYFEIALDANADLGRWDMTGTVMYSELDEEISPSTRQSVSLNASTQFLTSMRLSASAGITRADIENSPEDIDRVDIRIGLNGRAWRGAQFRFDVLLAEDSGGTLSRRDLTYMFNLDWQYRSVRMTFDARYADNVLGDSVRSRMEISARLRREF